MRLEFGDCLEILPTLPRVDVVITDPPYGDTSLEWDTLQDQWAQLIPADTFWCWGSFRYFLAARFPDWKLAQEVVWEKHNGSGFRADRFRRVHEICAQFYKGDWSAVYHETPRVPCDPDVPKQTVKRKDTPKHMHGRRASYEWENGHPRLMRSVIYARSMHRRALHPTQKPVEVLLPLVEASCPPGGTVLDPFMGSGSTGEACKMLGRNFIGIEKDPKYFAIACERLLCS